MRLIRKWAEGVRAFFRRWFRKQAVAVEAATGKRKRRRLTDMDLLSHLTITERVVNAAEFLTECVEGEGLRVITEEAEDRTQFAVWYRIDDRATVRVGALSHDFAMWLLGLHPKDIAKAIWHPGRRPAQLATAKRRRFSHLVKCAKCPRMTPRGTYHKHPPQEAKAVA